MSDGITALSDATAGHGLVNSTLAGLLERLGVPVPADQHGAANNPGGLHAG